MISAIDSDLCVEFSSPLKLEDGAEKKIYGLALQILSQLTQHTNDIGRIFNAFSYLATKIEDFQILEKFIFAFENKDTEQLEEFIHQIKNRPESIILKSIFCEYFEKALENNENEVIDLMWKELGGQLTQIYVDEILEYAIIDDNIDRVKWLLENFQMKLNRNEFEIISAAVEHDMFFILEELIEKYGDFDNYTMKMAFERFINSEAENCLKAARFFWPKVRDEISDYTLTEAIRNAAKNGNQAMITFLQGCMKEKRNVG